MKENVDLDQFFVTSQLIERIKRDDRKQGPMWTEVAVHFLTIRGCWILHAWLLIVGVRLCMFLKVSNKWGGRRVTVTWEVEGSIPEPPCVSACVLEFLRPQKCVKLLDNTKLALGVSQNGCMSCNLSGVVTPPLGPHPELRRSADRRRIDGGKLLLKLPTGFSLL